MFRAIERLCGRVVERVMGLAKGTAAKLMGGETAGLDPEVIRVFFEQLTALLQAVIPLFQNCPQPPAALAGIAKDRTRYYERAWARLRVRRGATDAGLDRKSAIALAEDLVDNGPDDDDLVAAVADLSDTAFNL